MTLATVNDGAMGWDSDLLTEICRRGFEFFSVDTCGYMRFWGPIWRPWEGAK